MEVPIELQENAYSSNVACLYSLAMICKKWLLAEKVSHVMVNMLKMIDFNNFHKSAVQRVNRCKNLKVSTQQHRSIQLKFTL